MPSTHQYSFFDFTPEMENNGKWIYLLPTVALGAVGAACIPHFALGLAIGACEGIVYLTLCKIVGGLIPTSTNLFSMRREITHFTLTLPSFEGLLFRGLMQPLLLLMMGELFTSILSDITLSDIFSETTVNMLFCMFLCQLMDLRYFVMSLLLISIIATHAPQLISIIMLGASINATSVLVVCVTALISGGFLHLPDKTKAVLSTLLGIALGLVALKYGLFASIAMHMMHNTLETMMCFFEDERISQSDGKRISM